jgi:hypothetical protein
MGDRRLTNRKVPDKAAKSSSAATLPRPKASAAVDDWWVGRRQRDDEMEESIGFELFMRISNEREVLPLHTVRRPVIGELQYQAG